MFSPTEVDPLDETYMSLHKSPNLPEQEASEGAFAKIDTPRGTVFSLYSGYVLDEIENEILSRWRADRLKKAHDNEPERVQQLSERMCMYKYGTSKRICCIFKTFV